MLSNQLNLLLKRMRTFIIICIVFCNPFSYAQTTIEQSLVHSCGNLHGKCKDVCEAANELKSAADDLSNCAKKHDYSNDCRNRYRDTKDKFEQYENAVSDASDDCS
jgi:hypothetical protein